MVLKPVLYCILACFLWGFVFAVPLYLENFSCIDIVLGRYFMFGMVSIIFLIIEIFISNSKDILMYWKQASFCALVMNFSYYMALTLGMRSCHPSVMAVMIAMAPLVIIVLNSKVEKSTVPYSLFLWPAFFIFFGIALINIQAIHDEWQHLTVWQYLKGLLYGLFALGAWSWYVIYNTHLLQTNPTINPRKWTLLIGAVTLGFSVIGMTARYWIMDASYAQQFSIQHQGVQFIAGTFILGLLCSWLAFTLWNMASTELPSELSSQLAILETVFSLGFIYMIHHQWPTILEIGGALLILGGVWRGLYNFSTFKKQSTISSQNQIGEI